MYHGEHEAKHLKRRRRSNKKAVALSLSLLLIAVMTVGGTLAYLTAQTKPVSNIFKPSHVACQVEESFDGTVKKNVNVRNTGDTDAYVRVKLVTYRVNDERSHIGGTATIPDFTPGMNWVPYGDYYYYTLPVAPGKEPTDDLIESISLTASYTDADGGCQAIDVIAEAIQNEPAAAVGEAWGISIVSGEVLAYQGGAGN